MSRIPNVILMLILFNDLKEILNKIPMHQNIIAKLKH